MKQCAGRSEERKSWSDFRWVHHYHQPLCGNEKVSEPFGQWGGCRSLSRPFHTRRRAIDTVVHMMSLKIRPMTSLTRSEEKKKSEANGVYHKVFGAYAPKFLERNQQGLERILKKIQWNKKIRYAPKAKSRQTRG